ncbi:MAG TPA: HRDC domain-containing protein [Ilumatobacteraceae bacterium]|nr:HRDC domain-containing protein [Ilumatobacteraceae bacterium]
MTYRWIDSSDEVAGYVERVLAEPRYALDTEFHRERTYFPKLALVQIAAAGEIVLIDPLACDLSPLKQLFAGDPVCVAHAAQQDLDVLTHAVGAVPRHLYDTQLAAGFLGYSTPSLVSLLQSELRVTAGKGDRLTDWLRRPLSADQRDYAASDVAHLLQLQDTLDVKLAAEGRAEWVADACEELRTRPVSGTEPDLAWTRLKDVRVLKPRARGVARAVAAWRERRAMAIDSPVRQVLPDLAILGISQKQPTTVAELGQCRGVDDRHTRGVIATDILAAVREGMANEASMPAGDGEELDRSLRPAVTLVSAWVSEVARQRRIDTALLATRNDLVAFLRGDTDARLATGWRGEFLGEGIRRLVAGQAALTFDGRGGLSLIDITPP